MSIKLFVSFLSVTILATSCTKAIIDENPESNPPVTKTVYYNPDVQAIMYNNCVTCHSGSAPSAGLRLDNYTDTRYATENGNVIERMNSTTSPMPPNGVLPPLQRQLMDKWVLDGFLEK